MHYHWTQQTDIFLIPQTEILYWNVLLQQKSTIIFGILSAFKILLIIYVRLNQFGYCLYTLCSYKGHIVLIFYIFAAILHLYCSEISNHFSHSLSDLCIPVVRFIKITARTNSLCLKTFLLFHHIPPGMQRQGEPDFQRQTACWLVMFFFFCCCSYIKYHSIFQFCFVLFCVPGSTLSCELLHLPHEHNTKTILLRIATAHLISSRARHK